VSACHAHAGFDNGKHAAFHHSSLINMPFHSNDITLSKVDNIWCKKEAKRKRHSQETTSGHIPEYSNFAVEYYYTVTKRGSQPIALFLCDISNSGCSYACRSKT
jgi:hypothetical protein